MWWKVEHLLLHPSLPQTITHGEIIIPTVVKYTFYSSEMLRFHTREACEPSLSMRVGNFELLYIIYIV